jgi:hypothetical protein
MQNDITQYQSFPLPHPSNELQDDVLRLRDAISTIDAKFHALDVLLQSDDVSLDQVQELVNYIKENRDDIVSIMAAKADKTYVDNGLSLKANTSDVDAALALKAASTYVDAQIAAAKTYADQGDTAARAYTDQQTAGVQQQKASRGFALFLKD